MNKVFIVMLYGSIDMVCSTNKKAQARRRALESEEGDGGDIEVWTLDETSDDGWPNGEE